MKRILLILAAMVAVAAAPGDTLTDLESKGFYIEPGADASSDVVGDAVTEAGFDGGRLFIVVLKDEPASGATFFADSVLDDLQRGTVLTVAPETIGWASDGDTWSEEQLAAATDAALDGTSDDAAVTLFVDTLGKPSAGSGGTEAGASSGSGGGGSGLVWFLIIGGALVALFFFLRSRSNATSRAAKSSRLGEFQSAAQAKLDEIANDILEMEEEVRLAENRNVSEHYGSASATYTELADTIGNARTPQELLDVTYRLDFAIWELDVAEAILDGKNPPPKPKKPELEKPETISKPAAPSLRTSPEFQRRPQRQSSPGSPDLASILMALLAAQGMGRNRGRGDTWGRSRPPSSGGGFGGGGGSGGRRIRGGGRRRG